MAHWVGAQGQVNSPKMQKHALNVTSPSENLKSKTKKIYLTCSWRLAESTKGLNSSLPQSACESWRCKLFKICKKVEHPNWKGRRWKRFHWIADDISKWCLFKNLCWHLCLMGKPLLSKHVRYSKKLAEKFGVAQKPVMFMNDFDNFNEKCRRWNRFHWIADDISKWCSFKNLCWRLSLMRRPLLFKHVQQ